jgi:hypothetical protein
MTKSQFATLRWLSAIGGVCVAWRDKVAHPSEALKRSGKLTSFNSSEPLAHQLMPSVSALHLIQQGHIEPRGGQLHITEKGRAALAPFGKAA